MEKKTNRFDCKGKDCLLCQGINSELSSKKKSKHPFLRNFKTVVTNLKDLINK